MSAERESSGIDLSYDPVLGDRIREIALSYEGLKRTGPRGAGNGMTIEEGITCSAFLRLVYDQVYNLPILPFKSSEGKIKNRKPITVSDFYQLPFEVEWEQRQCGDALLCSHHPGEPPRHAAIYLGGTEDDWGRFIDSTGVDYGEIRTCPLKNYLPLGIERTEEVAAGLYSFRRIPRAFKN